MRRSGHSASHQEILVNELVLLTGKDDTAGNGGYSRASGSSASFDQRPSAANEYAQSAVSWSRKIGQRDKWEFRSLTAM